VLEEARAGAVLPQGDRFRAVLGGDPLHLPGHVVECLVPGDGLELLLASFTCADEGLRDAIGIVVRADGGGAARAQAPLAHRVEGCPQRLRESCSITASNRRGDIDISSQLPLAEADMDQFPVLS
jgi:hypothetical protein